MKRLLAALLLVASPALAQSNGWQEIQNGWGEIQTVPAAPGSTHTAATDVTTFTGSVTAKNLTATALATPTVTSVTPTLTKIGSITTVAGASLVDGDYFTIKYDTGLTVPIEFDAAPGDGTTGGRVPYVFAPGDTADAIRDGLITLLNAAAGTALTASSGGAATVSLVLDTPGAAGDTNTENVANAGFAVTGFVNPTAATTYGYKVVSYLADGVNGTAASTEVTTAAGHATLSASNYVTVVFAPSAGSTSTRLYRTTGGAAPPKLIYTGTATSYVDTGAAGTAQTPATSNGTGVVTADTLVGSGLTAGRVPIVGTGGRVEDDAGLTYDAGTDTLTAGSVLRSNVNVYAGNAVFALQHQVRSDGNFAFSSTTDPAGVPDSGLRRVSPGLVGVTDGSTGNGALQTGGVQYVTGSRPTCDAAARGMTWYVAGGAGVADTFEVCRKDNLDAYAWVSLF